MNNTTKSKKNLLQQILYCEIPKKYQNCSDSLVCRFSLFCSVFATALLFIFGIFMMPSMIYSVLIETSQIANYLLAYIFLLLGLCYIGGGCVSILMRKNWMVEQLLY